MFNFLSHRRPLRRPVSEPSLVGYAITGYGIYSARVASRPDLALGLRERAREKRGMRTYTVGKKEFPARVCATFGAERRKQSANRRARLFEEAETNDGGEQRIRKRISLRRAVSLFPPPQPGGKFPLRDPRGSRLGETNFSRIPHGGAVYPRSAPTINTGAHHVTGYFLPDYRVGPPVSVVSFF